MARRQLAFTQHDLHIIRQIEQTQEIGDVAPTFAERFRNFFLRVAKLLHQLTIPHRLFNRIQIRTLDVLNNRYFKNFGVVVVANNNGQLMKLRHLRSTPTTLSGNNFIAISRLFPHDQRLNHTLFSDRVRKILKLFRCKIASWLIWVGFNPLNWHHKIRATGRRFCVLTCCFFGYIRHQGAQSATETPLFFLIGHAGSPLRGDL
mmetsp:Transcript_29366/g.57287  ORF Transcript_29366/g.57287 Transcript_29366/m.57287 type:complete len:204 (-) Transcript_29366:7382-7993(-)